MPQRSKRATTAALCASMILLNTTPAHAQDTTEPGIVDSTIMECSVLLGAKKLSKLNATQEDLQSLTPTNGSNTFNYTDVKNAFGNNPEWSTVDREFQEECAQSENTNKISDLTHMYTVIIVLSVVGFLALIVTGALLDLKNRKRRRNIFPGGN